MKFAQEDQDGLLYAVVTECRYCTLESQSTAPSTCCACTGPCVTTTAYEQKCNTNLIRCEVPKSVQGQHTQQADGAVLQPAGVALPGSIYLVGSHTLHFCPPFAA